MAPTLSAVTKGADIPYQTREIEKRVRSGVFTVDPTRQELRSYKEGNKPGDYKCSDKCQLL